METKPRKSTARIGYSRSGRMSEDYKYAPRINNVAGLDFEGQDGAGNKIEVVLRESGYSVRINDTYIASNWSAD